MRTSITFTFTLQGIEFTFTFTPQSHLHHAIALFILLASITFTFIGQGIETTCDKNEEYCSLDVLIYGAHNLYEPKPENQLIAIIKSPTNNKQNNLPKVPYFRGNLVGFKESVKQQHSSYQTAIQIANEPVKFIHILDYAVEIYVFDDSILMNEELYDIFTNIFDDLYLNKICGVNEKEPNCAQSLKIYHSRKCNEETSQNTNGEQLCTDMLLDGNKYNYIIHFDDIHGVNTYECDEMNENNDNAVSTNNKNQIKTDDTKIISTVNDGDYIGEYIGVIVVIGIIFVLFAIVIIIILLCMMNRKSGGVHFKNKGATHINNFNFYTQ